MSVDSLFRMQNKDTETSFNLYLTCGFFGVFQGTAGTEM
jgi:hypothetical protein